MVGLMLLPMILDKLSVNYSVHAPLRLYLYICVFLWRTWASVRVMTADQRAELLTCVVNDDLNKKLPFKECEKIAEDLNLTLEQVSLYLSFLD
ncbi:hypothetical protein RHGRI_024082 [Rhododendron griersonianum]|uniref:DUF7645 domain-containing protein n=1 Tax=Rhododendron griersonianum TaxID=479676 RepID=A0AAV6JBH7_9ERIC|nr:hypothetical protein RHGRI_024082 [Rhododendron griersonianum]